MKSNNDLLSKVKKRLKQFAENSQKNSNNDYIWKPTGEHVVRLVPYKYSDFPFIELYFYYNLGKRSILSPKSFDLPDPIIKFADELRQTGDKRSYELSKKLYPKMRIYVPVVVRGEEQHGVRFFGMSKTTYEQILKIIDDSDYGNILDPYTGTDLVITFNTPEETGTTFGKIVVRPKRNSSRLAETDEQINKFLSEQKEITEVFKLLSYDELIEVLNNWLNDSYTDENEEENNSEEIQENEYNLENNKKEKVNKNKKENNNIINDEDENIVEMASEAFEKLFKNKK